MENTGPGKINLEEQLALADQMYRQAQLDATFKEGIVHALRQLVKNEPVILRTIQSPSPPPVQTEHTAITGASLP